MAPPARLNRMIGRLGGLETSSRHDPRVYTAKARQTFLSRFALEVDPDQVLPPAERERRADALRRAHMTRLALKSAQARACRRRRAMTDNEVA